MAEDLERNSVPTHNKFITIPKVPAAGNYYKDVWLLKYRVTGELEIRKEFGPEDVASGFAAREIAHLKRLKDYANVCTYKEHELNQRAPKGALVMQVCAYGVQLLIPPGRN
jgi:hypothetical protein